MYLDFNITLIEIFNLFHSNIVHQTWFANSITTYLRLKIPPNTTSFYHQISINLIDQTKYESRIYIYFLLSKYVINVILCSLT